MRKYLSKKFHTCMHNITRFCTRYFIIKLKTQAIFCCYASCQYYFNCFIHMKNIKMLKTSTYKTLDFLKSMLKTIMYISIFSYIFLNFQLFFPDSPHNLTLEGAFQFSVQLIYLEKIENILKLSWFLSFLNHAVSNEHL